MTNANMVDNPCAREDSTQRRGVQLASQLGGVSYDCVYLAFFTV